MRSWITQILLRHAMWASQAAAAAEPLGQMPASLLFNTRLTPFVLRALSLVFPVVSLTLLTLFPVSIIALIRPKGIHLRVSLYKSPQLQFCLEIQEITELWPQSQCIFLVSLMILCLQRLVFPIRSQISLVAAAILLLT